MTREELLRSPEYWTLEIQMKLYKVITDFMENNNMKRNQLAKKFGFTKGYISQILNGEYDHRISKLVELALAIGLVPRVEYLTIEKILQLDKNNKLHTEKDETPHLEMINSFSNDISGIIEINPQYDNKYLDMIPKYHKFPKEVKHETRQKEKYEFA